MDELLQVANATHDNDGTVKLQFITSDGGSFESSSFYVGRHLNICCSTQIGCVNKCLHCASREVPFLRNLTSEELIQQIAFLSDKRNETFDILFLGMGDPFVNFQNVFAAYTYFCKEGATQIEDVLLCTSGMSNNRAVLQLLSHEPQRPNIVFSVHAVPDTLRQKIIPHTLLYNLDSMKKDILFYTAKTDDYVFVNYTPLLNINDKPEQLKDFALWCRDIHNCIVRIIPFNTWQGTALSPASNRTIEDLIDLCKDYGVRADVRPSYGTAINAGCGQLRGDKVRREQRNEM